MSYMSNVRFHTVSEGYEAFLDLLPDEVKNGNSLFISGQPAIVERRGDEVMFGWDYVDWIDYRNRDVSAVMKTFHTVGCEDYPFEFLRMGEYVNDVEFYSYHEYEMDLSLTTKTCICLD